MLLIEHHMEVVLGLADRVTVLDFGRKLAEGTPQEVAANQAVIDAYLGAETEQAAEEPTTPVGRRRRGRPRDRPRCSEPAVGRAAAARCTT